MCTIWVMDTAYYKNLLLAEKKKIEDDLAPIAQRNPDAPQDWEVKYPDMNVMTAAPEEVADQEEEFENRASLQIGLESQLRDINDALERINDGTYGTCAGGGEPIDEARLRANPASRNCTKHEPPTPL